MGRIFGFDIGTTSIGWAIIEYDPGAKNGQIVAMGARIFPEARDPKGTPLNQTRRQKRMVRRQLRRRRQRRRALNEALTQAGLLPAFSAAPAARGQTQDAWHVAMRGDPLASRTRGLSEKLEPHELGRALYHLAQRRHFRGRDLEEDSPAETDEGTELTADEQQAAADRNTLLAQLRKSGQTLGQYLFSLPGGQRRRGVHAHRSMVAEEFDRLWRAQEAYHPTLRDAGFRARIEDAIFAQRPVFWRKNTLGDCSLMPGAELCPKGSWLSQQRRMLEKLNNLALVGGNARPLDADERTAILEKLQSQAKMGWSGVRNALKPLFKARGEKGGEKTLRFNLEDSDKSGLPGNMLEMKLAGIFGEAWTDHTHRQSIRDAIHTRLWSADYGQIGVQRVVIRPQTERAQRRQAAAQTLIADFGITSEQAQSLAALSLPTGWEPYSMEALRRILPRLEDGIRFGSLLNAPEWQAWRDENFPDRMRPTGEILDRLPSPTRKHPEELERIAGLRNPTVVRVHNELRKVVNNLIAAYGKPDLTRIELTRDVGKSKREREETLSGQRRRETQRKKAKAELEKCGLDPSGDDIEKYLLWKECGEFDPYSGQAISFDALFRTGDFDVEHIWPRGQCFDNSFANKTLCLKAWNHHKANKTPFEAFGTDLEAWSAMKERMWKHVKDGRMARGKAKRFCREETLPEDFTARQFNDTGYAARQATAFLKRLWPDTGPESPVMVQTVSGRVTAQLRKLWGLNYVLADSGEKTRADHRHHAVDALVVACAHPGMTNLLSRYWQVEDRPNRGGELRLDPPWPMIRADAQRAVATIVVSHRVRKKVSGPLHKETIYGDTREDETTKNGTYRRFVTRKSVVALSKGEIDDIRDERVREVVRRHVEAHGGDPKKAFPPFPILHAGGPPIHKVRLRSKQQMKLMAKVATGYADLGANHHIAIYRQPSGKAEFEVVSLFEASRRLARREPIVRKAGNGKATFLMSLSQGDTLRFAKEDGKEPSLWRVQKIASKGQISLLDLSDASPDEPSLFEPIVGGLISRNAVKLSIDPIGRVRPAND